MSKKIIVEFYYKDAVIATRKTDKLFTKKGKRDVIQLIAKGLIRKPENWDRYHFVEYDES